MDELMSNPRDHSTERLRRRDIPKPLPYRAAARMPAWLVSVAFHVVVLTTLAVLWRSQVHGTGAESGGPIGIAVVHQSRGGQEFFLSDATSDAEEGASSDSAAAAVAVAAAAAIPSQAEVGSPADALLEDLL